MTESDSSSQSNSLQKTVSKSIMIKLGFVALVFVGLQIPLFMINGVMEERQTYNVEYPEKYNGPGAAKQTIVGPILTIPYTYVTTIEKTITLDNDGTKPNKDKNELTSVKTKTIKETKTRTGALHFFPEKLSISGNLEPSIRDQGKFKSILYKTALEFEGTFDTSNFKRKKIEEKDLKWEEAFITLGISDLRGIRKETTLKWDDKNYNFIPGVNGLKLFEKGQFVEIPDLKSGAHKFSFTVSLNGSRELSVFPAGKENAINLSSSWQNPTFSGGFLPTRKKVTEKGFNSFWEVSYFSRNLPQQWTDREKDIKNSLAQYMVGVTLSTPVEFYRTSIRAVKYGGLFIVLTFLTFFIFEIVNPIKVHEIQYLLVGLALCIFFLMLIAISEWIPFLWAYVLSSIPTIGQITWYTQSFSKEKNNLLWKVMAFVLVLLYTYMYILLQMESLSLLVGSIGLFVALSVVLYSVRNIDWYSEKENEQSVTE